MVIFDEARSDERVKTLRRKEEEDLAQTLSAHHGIPYLDLSAHPINIDALRVLKEAEARDAEVAVFNATDKQVQIGVLSPKSEKVRLVVEGLKQKGFIPELFMVSHQSLNKVWDRYKDLSYSYETKSGALDLSNNEILALTEKVRTLSDIKLMIEEVLALKRAYKISRILEIL